MTYFTGYILLIVFAVIIGISQSTNDCFYNPGDLGKKCYDESHSMYTCCPLDHHCQQGKCNSLGGSLPPKHVPIHTYILIGVGGLAVVGIVGIIVAAIYRHRKQMKEIDEQFKPFRSFSQSSILSIRNNNSVGFRVRTTTSQPPVVETTVNIETPTTAKPAEENISLS